MTAAAIETPFGFNPFDPELRRDPYAHYARGRREFPAFRHAGLPVVSVFGYADTLAILRDPQQWSSNFPPPPGVDPADIPEPSMLGQDPPHHTRLRSLVSQAFTPRMVRQLEPRLVEVAHALLDDALERGEVDLVEALTYPLPVTAIAEIIGVPTEDRHQFKQWSDAAVANLGNIFFSQPPAERLRELGELLQEMGRYFSALADERRRAPQDDLLTGLVQAEVEGSKLNHDEMLQMLTLLLVAGNETTTTLIGNSVLELLAHPEALAQLRADPGLVPSAIEEVLRFASPVQMDPRRAVAPAILHGVEVEAGQFVIAWIGSANRDEAIFADADRFDIRREDNRHISFGFGPHYCLGSNLARLEAQVALRVLLERTESFERTTSEPLPIHPSIVFRGVTQLPLRLRAAHSRRAGAA